MTNRTLHRDVRGVRFTEGVGTKIDVSNVTTPTAAELIAAYGPAAENAGMVFLQDDNNADTTVKLVACNGTSYFFAALTKAT
jgi:hypothetical protein